ncbi:MAG: tRNA (N(6)-L-threonylcarbamoyladenosine(37)-C(2))-methylthiotransferase MtaB [Desulfobacterales bacterium]|nr:tRNA (N(6)-L-threonylcarbamoyladenosine(37)-C(2))-methylthiotransferase MtaB [Desulfobacterales bacterium]
MKKKTFYIQTLGCKVNQYESDGIASGLEDSGLIRGETRQGADICIINTCAVTSKAGMQSRQAIRKLIRENPDAEIVVTGCHAQTDPDQIRQIPDIDHIVCHKDKGKIAQCIAGECKETPSQPSVPFSFQKPDFDNHAQFLRFDKPVSGSMTRAYLKIQDGCNAFCTYCIVPYARGASVSMPKREVLNHLEGLAGKGFREVIITGIHTGMYGHDLTPPTSLADLIREADKKQQVERLRISSIEPNEISQALIDLAGPGRILCDHFHIPLQAGDNEVLKRMKRPYTTEEFESVIHKIHDTLPYAGIGLDTLIGFPGETDAQFENTYRLVKRLPVSYLHVFPFSARKGTPAFHFDPKVPSEVIKERCARMRELDQQKRAEFIKINRGRPLRALVQHQEDKATGMLKAVISNYLTVHIPKKQELKGKIIDLTYEQCDSKLNIIGKVIN